MNLYERVNSGASLKAGALAGLIGGGVMAVCLMLYSFYTGFGFWTPLVAISATFYGANALGGGILPLVTGLFIHGVVSACLGLLFAAWLSPRANASRAVLVGTFFGVGAWAVMTFVALNLVNPIMRSLVAEIPAAWFIVHMVYGVCLGAVPPIRNALAPVKLEPRSKEYLERAA